MENMLNTNKNRLSADLYLIIHGVWRMGMKSKQDDLDWKFQTYRGTNVDNDMLWGR